MNFLNTIANKDNYCYIRDTYRGSEKPVKFESKGVGHNENYHQRKKY